MSHPWRTIELIPSLSAVGSEWQRLWGNDFGAFQSHLQNTGRRTDSFPCPRECGCAHRVVVHAENEMVAVCECEPCACDNIPLTAGDATVWKLNEAKLGRAVVKALGCDGKEMDLGIRRTKQIGSFGSESLPIILTVQHDQESFSSVVGQLVARMQGPFILLAPSRQFFDGNSQGLLRNVKAGFFDLESNVNLTSSGILHAPKNAGELFSQYLPQEEKSSPVQTKKQPKYLLRKEHGIWRLVLDGQEAQLKDEKGLYYASYLLKNPSELIHGSELASKAIGDAVVENQRNIAADDSETFDSMRKARLECQAVLDDEDATPMERDEAEMRLAEIDSWARKNMRGTEGNEQRQVRAIRQAIRRLLESLESAEDEKHGPHKVARAFGKHLDTYLWKPSSRASGRRKKRVQAELAGRFVYEPPEGVRWSE